MCMLNLSTRYTMNSAGLNANMVNSVLLIIHGLWVCLAFDVAF